MSFFVLLICVLFICNLFEKKVGGKSAGELIPTSFLSIMVFLFPFYCLDILKIGRFFIYLFILGTAVWLLKSIKCGKVRAVSMVISPSTTIFILASFIIVLMARDNFVALWDETRLWGAVPKALWYTEKLQLGEEALVFPIMQSYYPGMPLLVYFFTALESEFQEWHVFVIYGIFVCSFLMPACRRLKWNQWIYFLPIALLFVILPCIATSNGGDYAYFYESLFIDAVLGAVIGYSLFLSTQEPFHNYISAYSFAVSLIAIVLLKDSGILFSIMILTNAFILNFTRKNIKRKMYLFLLGIVCLTYFSWQILLNKFMVKNPVGLKVELNIGSVISLVRKFFSETMIYYQARFWGITFSCTFIFCIFILLCISMFLTKKYHDLTKKEASITVMSLAISSIIFCLGYCMAYGSGLPSFQRYIGGTILNAAITYVFLRVMRIIIENYIEVSVKQQSKYMPIYVCLASAFFTHFLVGWNTANHFNLSPYNEALSHSSKIEASLPRNEIDEKVKIYLYYPGDASANCLLHQRIYMNLIGSGACIKNFYNDVNIINVETEINDYGKMKVAVEQWLDKLIDENDYIYFLSVDERTEFLFETFLGFLPNEKELYKIEKDSKKLVPCTYKN